MRCGPWHWSFLAMCICRRKAGAFPPAPMRISALPYWFCAYCFTSSTRSTSARLPCSMATRPVPARYPKPAPRRRHGSGQQPRCRTYRRIPRHRIRGPQGTRLSRGQSPLGTSHWPLCGPCACLLVGLPRLAAALFMVLLASLCVPLIFLYLTRLGAERWAALLAEGVHPPWWLSIPFAAGRASELRFVLTVAPRCLLFIPLRRPRRPNADRHRPLPRTFDQR